MGVLLASHPQAGELSRSLMTFKDLMLVAFFVQIGLHGTPHALEVGLALLLLLLLPLQVAAYAVVLWLMRLRRRTSFLAGLVLSNYSEFGIIVVAVGASTGLLDDQWVVVVSLAVAFSFGLSAVVNRRGVELASRLSRLLPARDSDRLHPDDRLVDIGDADALVLGLGRVGSATYARLRDEYGLSVVGVEHDQTRVFALEDEGYEVVRADATDLEFWNRVQRAGRVKMAVLAMPFHNANLIALARLQAAGFTGKVAAVARYDDDVAELERHGADAVFHLYGSAGFALADHAAEVLLQGRGGTATGSPPACATGRRAGRARPARPAGGTRVARQIPWARAQATASARVDTPILRYALRSWDFTVLRVTHSRAAMSSSVMSSPSSPMTTRSRWVRALTPMVGIGMVCWLVTVFLLRCGDGSAREAVPSDGGA